jgi:hypothetical protein
VAQKQSLEHMLLQFKRPVKKPIEISEFPKVSIWQQLIKWVHCSKALALNSEKVLN